MKAWCQGKTTHFKNKNQGLGLDVVAYAYNLTYLGDEVWKEDCRFESRPGKKLARPYLNKQGIVVAPLWFQVCRGGSR
jgi:hypothetical protein